MQLLHLVLLRDQPGPRCVGGRQLTVMSFWLGVMDYHHRRIPAVALWFELLDGEEKEDIPPCVSPCWIISLKVSLRISLIGSGAEFE